MANIKSAQKRARQNVVRRKSNLARKTALKTAVKKVLLALEAQKLDEATLLLREAEGQLARAAGKHLIHKKTASRKTSRLAQRVADAIKAATPQKAL